MAPGEASSPGPCPRGTNSPSRRPGGTTVIRGVKPKRSPQVSNTQWELDKYEMHLMTVTVTMRKTVKNTDSWR